MDETIPFCLSVQRNKNKCQETPDDFVTNSRSRSHFFRRKISTKTRASCILARVWSVGILLRVCSNACVLLAVVVTSQCFFLSRVCVFVFPRQVVRDGHSNREGQRGRLVRPTRLSPGKKDVRSPFFFPLFFFVTLIYGYCRNLWHLLSCVLLLLSMTCRYGTIQLLLEYVVL